MYVIKRTGDIVKYDLRKIKNAILGANKDSKSEMSNEDILHVVEEIDREIKEVKDLTVEEIQDTVEDQLMKAGFYKTAKEYIKYRQVHEIRRNAAQHLMESYNKLLFADAKDMDLKRDNANIDGNGSMGIMLKLGTEGAKVFYDNYATPEEFIDADREGIIHIHDKDFSLITFNCVDGNTVVRIKDSRNIIRDVQFKYFDSLFDYFQCEVLDASPLGIKTLSINGKYTTVKKIMRYKHFGKMLKVTLNSGHKIIVTKDHPSVIEKENEIKTIPSNLLQIGDKFILADYDKEAFGKISFLNLIDELSDIDEIVIYNSKLVRKSIKENKKTLFYDILNDVTRCKDRLSLYNKKYTIREYRAIRHLLEIDESKLMLAYSNGSNYVPAILSLSKELGKLCGYIASEGRIGKHEVTFANQNLSILDDFVKCARKTFPDLELGYYSCGGKNTSNSDKINIFGKIAAELFRNCVLFKDKSNYIDLPQWYDKAPLEFLCGFFSAEIDGDGSINNSCQITTCSKIFASRMQDLLQKIGIKSGVSCKKTAGEKVVINGVSSQRNYDSYNIRISSKDLDLLCDFIVNSCYKMDGAYEKRNRKDRVWGKIVSIEEIPFRNYVYDFETENHYFVANGIITHNCLQMNLAKTLKNGFSTGHGFIREPNSIRSAASLACINLQSSQNDCYGGQSLSNWDGALAKYVRKSFVKTFKKELVNALRYSFAWRDKEVAFAKKMIYNEESDIKNCFPSYLNMNIKKKTSLFSYIHDYFKENREKNDGQKIMIAIERAYENACELVEDETMQAMEGAIHNFNTLHSRAGAQVPFSSILFGMDTSPEGRLVTKMTLQAIYNGLGHGETAIFPK